MSPSLSLPLCKTALLIQFRCSGAWRHEMLIPEFKWSETIAILRENKNNVPIRFGPPSMSSEGELRGFANSMVCFRTDLPRCSCYDQLGTTQCSAQAHTHRHVYRQTHVQLPCMPKKTPPTVYPWRTSKRLFYTY